MFKKREKTEKEKKEKKMKKIIEKIKATLEIITAPLAAVLFIWADIDYTLFITATAGVIISILNYIEFLFPSEKNKE
jgi:O-antigen/teichoic acid export membrane protein